MVGIWEGNYTVLKDNGGHQAIESNSAHLDQVRAAVLKIQVHKDAVCRRQHACPVNIELVVDRVLVAGPHTRHLAYTRDVDP